MGMNSDFSRLMVALEARPKRSIRLKTSLSDSRLLIGRVMSSINITNFSSSDVALHLMPAIIRLARMANAMLLDWAINCPI